MKAQSTTMGPRHSKDPLRDAGKNCKVRATNANANVCSANLEVSNEIIFVFLSVSIFTKIRWQSDTLLKSETIYYYQLQGSLYKVRHELIREFCDKMSKTIMD